VRLVILEKKIPVQNCLLGFLKVFIKSCQLSL
jgi:hypothetical protein